MSKKGTHKKAKSKGPKLDISIRLWKRVQSLPGDWWNQEWDVETLTLKLVEHEHVTQQYKQKKEFAKAYDANLQYAFVEARKSGTYAVRGEKNTLKFRSPKDIERLTARLEEWKGLFESTSIQDLQNEASAPSSNASILIEAWQSILKSERLPSEFSIDQSTELRHWPGFELVEQAKKCAMRLSKLRFRHAEPSMALLLVHLGVWNANDIMTSRLHHLRKEGKNPFAPVYPTSLVDHVSSLPEVDGALEISRGRTDLRHLEFVTIDPVDAKDFDDAICLETSANGQKLWVAIADVAHYVVPHTSLDDEAYARATSVYLPHAVLPMLPPRLADELCSLRAEVDRLAMVVCLHIDKGATIVDTEVFEAVIRVRRNLSYEQALGNSAFDEHFLLAKRWQEGEIKLRLEQPEMRPRIAQDGSIRIEIKWPNEATKMIESFMVATNAAIGHFLGKRGAPLPWRCHPPPDPPEVESVNATFSALDLTIQLPMPSTRKHGQSSDDEFANILGMMGAGITIDTSALHKENNDETPPYLSAVLDPEARGDILKSLEKAQLQASELKSSTRRVVDQGLFQLMQRAYYASENNGHFGLNLDAYVHFTSPIRRYPDLLVHRQLKSLLHSTSWTHDEEGIDSLVEQCNQRARAAQSLEWGLVANAFGLKLLEGGQLFEHTTPYALDSKWKARVVGLRTPWIFLDLGDEGYISGRVHFKQFQPKVQLVTDEYNLKVLSAETEETVEQQEWLRVGQLVSCVIQGVDIWSGELDVRILNE
ncbi:MAG: RNB domain-containing ribonuclease [archaeon]|nr:RNB domain-containing ribonuclease [archaeon]